MRNSKIFVALALTAFNLSAENFRLSVNGSVLTWPNRLAKVEHSVNLAQWFDLGLPTYGPVSVSSPGFYRLRAIDPDGNSTNSPALHAGPVVLVCHDSGSNYYQFTNIMAIWDARLREFSYGRNWVVGILSTNCSGCIGGYCSSDDYSNWIDIWGINCPRTSCGFSINWNDLTGWHETMHCMGNVDEGYSWDYTQDPPVLLDNYGDLYDSMGYIHDRRTAAPHSEWIGWIGVNSPSKSIFVHTNGTAEYTIGTMESAAPGPVCVKVLKSRYLWLRTSGDVYQDRREFFYVEHRIYAHNGPAVQLRVHVPRHKGENQNFGGVSKFLSTIGDQGSLHPGNSFSYRQVLTTRRGMLPETVSTNTISISVLGCDYNSARISVVVSEAIK